MCAFTAIFSNEAVEWACRVKLAVLEYVTVSDWFIIFPPAYDLNSHILISICRIPLVLEEPTKTVFATMIGLAFIQYLVLKCFVDGFIPLLITGPEFDEAMRQALLMLSYKDPIDFDELSRRFAVTHFEFHWDS